MNQSVENYPYSRKNHFLDTLKSYEGCPDNVLVEIYPKILCEMEKMNISVDDVSLSTVALILRNLDLSKHYGSGIGIYLKIKSIELVKIDDDLRNQMVDMFDQISKSHTKCIKDTDRRSSFFSYNYIIFKIFQIVKYDFPYNRIMNTAVVNNYDDLWEKICQDLNWEFIPTFCEDGALLNLQGMNIKG